VRQLRDQGRSNDQIRGALTDMGYPAATVANVVPGNPSPAPATTTPAPSTTTEPADPPARRIDAPATGRALPPPGAGDLSGFVLGLLGTALLVNFMRGGPAGVRAWFSAKFLNNVTSSAPPTKAPRAGPGGSAPLPGPPGTYTSPDGGPQFDPPSGAGSSGV